MEALNKIESDLRDAIREKREVVMRTLRMLKSDIMYEKTKGSEDLTGEKIIEVIKRSAKRRKESIEEFTKAGRADLADRESEELVILEQYLPRQMGEDEVARIIDEKIAELGASSGKDFGKVMGALMKVFKGQADGNLVKEILTRKLENL
jgi:hypothetical protein